MIRFFTREQIEEKLKNSKTEKESAWWKKAMRHRDLMDDFQLPTVLPTCPAEPSLDQGPDVQVSPASPEAS